jgi:hypothetical protein
MSTLAAGKLLYSIPSRRGHVYTRNGEEPGKVVHSDDSISKVEADDEAVPQIYLPLTGGTLTGNLALTPGNLGVSGTITCTQITADGSDLRMAIVGLAADLTALAARVTALEG